jgi:sialic acid synthase SpsE
MSEYEYYKACQLSNDSVSFILSECKKKNLDSLFTVFSLNQAKRAKDLGIPFVKIASPNAMNDDLVAYCAGFGQFVISDGMIDSRKTFEIARAYPEARILHCISRYPAVWDEKEKEKALMLDGISDHSHSIDTALWAIRNDLWVERHYTLGKDLPGKDHGISSLPSEFDELSREQKYLSNIARYKERWTRK